MSGIQRPFQTHHLEWSFRLGKIHQETAIKKYLFILEPGFFWAGGAHHFLFGGGFGALFYFLPAFGLRGSCANRRKGKTGEPGKSAEMVCLHERTLWQWLFFVKHPLNGSRAGNAGRKRVGSSFRAIRP